MTRDGHSAEPGCRDRRRGYPAEGRSQGTYPRLHPMGVEAIVMKTSRLRVTTVRLSFKGKASTGIERPDAIGIGILLLI